MGFAEHLHQNAPLSLSESTSTLIFVQLPLVLVESMGSTNYSPWPSRLSAFIDVSLGYSLVHSGFRFPRLSSELTETTKPNTFSYLVLCTKFLNSALELPSI